MNKRFYDNEAEIICTDNDNIVTAEIDDFRLEDSLNVFIATNKIHMKWNGSVYVGNAFGMEFTTKGPKYSEYIGCQSYLGKE